MSEHTTRQVGAVTVVDVADSYTRATLLKLVEVVKEAVAAGARLVLLNMGRLPHIDNQGIGLLVLVHEQCSSAGGRMALCSLPESAAHVLKLAGLARFFKTYLDEEAGVSSLAREAAATGPAAGPGEGAPEGESGSPDIPSDPAELADAAHEVVRTTIRSRHHQQAIKFFSERATKLASLDEIAFALGIPRPAAELVMRDLSRNKIVLDDGEMFVWQPSPEAEAKLALFRRALGTPGLRTRVMAWLYAEEKK